MIGAQESWTRRAFPFTSATVTGAAAVAACTAQPPAAPAPTPPPAPPAPPGAPPAPRPAAPPAPLPDAALTVIGGPRYALSRWYVHVSDRATGAPLMELNA